MAPIEAPFRLWWLVAGKMDNRRIARLRRREWEEESANAAAKAFAKLGGDVWA